jgi:methylenetetrahydrofolate/methylenetetrahydromethanopterin dehydrogenase (NADP+)
MRKLLLQLDSSRLPSVFDRVVAYDGGADEVMSYGGITEADVRDLIHGCIFTRGPKDLKNTAVFVGGADIAVGEQLLTAATKAMFKPFTVSAMLDSNGSNTTAVAAVAKMVQAVGEGGGDDVRGKRVLIVAGTGPVGIRAAGLFAKAGADVCITSRKADAGERARDLVRKRFGGTVRAIALPDAKEAIRACERAELLLNAGPAGVMLVPTQAWANRPGLKVVADVNAVPPLGIEGVDVMDDGVTKEGVACFGALAIGNLKMKVHKACIARLFERNDLVLDAETIADVARELMAPKP